MRGRGYFFDAVYAAGVTMSLTGRFSAIFLSALALVLVGFSTVLYVSARIYLDRQVGDRLAAALAILAAAAEIHPDGVEWEPQERILPLGQESGADRLRWMVFDDRGRSRRSFAKPGRIRISQRRGFPITRPPGLSGPAGRSAGPELASVPASDLARRGCRIRVEGRGSSQGRGCFRTHSEVLHPSLVLTACAALDPIEATLATLGWFLVALSVGIWLVAAMLCRRLSRRALTPLTRMVASARGLDAADAGWCLDEAGTGDELDELGRAFNDLLSRLHVAYERQRRFSSDASHQLRTPLTVLIGQIEVALRQDRSGEEYRRILGSALARAVQLGRIVEALDVPRPRRSRCPAPGMRAIGPGSLGRRTPGRSTRDGRRGHGRPLRLAEAMKRGSRRIRLFSASWSTTCWTTPLSTADRGHRSCVETIREGDVVVLAVEDAGPGIIPEDLPRVFEPFYRSAQTRRRSSTGVGLGLAVVRRIAAAFGGSVCVRSEPGKGCRFEVRLNATMPPVGR